MEVVTDTPDALARFDTVDQIEERLKEVKGRLTDLDTEYGVRGYTTEAKAEWNDLNAEHDLIVARLAEIARRKGRLEEIASDPENTEPIAQPEPKRHSPQVIRNDWTHNPMEVRRNASTPEDEFRGMRDNALHWVEKDTYQVPVQREKVQAHIERLLDTIDYADPERGKVPSELARRIMVTGDPVYQRAFWKQVAGRGLDPDEQRALSQTTTAGGFALVYKLDPTIIPTSDFSVNPYRAIARVEQIAGTNEWKAVTSGAITAAYGAELTEASDNAPTLAQPDIIVEKAQAFVPFSIEIGEDWGALESSMAMLLSDAKDDLEALKFATGTGHGSNLPKGVLAAGITTVNTTTTAAFVVADVYKLLEGLPARYRPRGKFVGALQIINKVRQFDTSGGSGVWAGPMSFGLQAQSDAGAAGSVQNPVAIPLLGRPFYETTGGFATALTTGGKILLCGDFRYFVIVDRVGMNIELIPHMFATANNRPSGQRGLYAHWRNSSDVTAATAFSVLMT